MNQLTIQQQVWLSAWTAAIQSGKYNPSEEAKSCLEAFDQQFGEPKRIIPFEHPDDQQVTTSDK
jgi:hypothetical protein